MKHITILILTMLTMAGCSDALVEKPQSIAAELFYNNPAEVEAGLNSIYVPIRRGSTLGALYECQHEIYTEYMYGRGSHAPLNDYTGLDQTNVARVGDMWAAFYESIRNANIVIQKAPLGSKLSPAQVEVYLAEARFMRALMYFYLVRNWAGVPIRDENNMDVRELARNTQEQVYAFILSDLEWAETRLPDNPRASGTPSKWSAKTILTDVYMNLHQYDKARDMAAAVIESKKYSLVAVEKVDEFEKIFGADISTSPEEIFYLKYARVPNTQGFSYPQYCHYPNSGYYPPGILYLLQRYGRKCFPEKLG